MRAPANAPSTFGFSQSTGYLASNPNYSDGVFPNLQNQIDNPFSAMIAPPGASGGMLTDLGQGVWFLNPNYKNPSFWNYSVGAERQFLQHDLVNIAYVGTRLSGGDSQDDINHRPASLQLPCNLQVGGDPRICDNNWGVNPFQGVHGFEASEYYTDTQIQNIDLSRPFPQYGNNGISEYQLNAYRTWYNSLQVTAMHKWSKSLTLHGTWTWSKLMDAGGYQGQTEAIHEAAPKAQDMTNRRVKTKQGVDEEQKRKNRTKSRVRAKVEWPFRILKRVFGYTKVRYRGILKNHHWHLAAFALVNLYQHRKRLVPQGA